MITADESRTIAIESARHLLSLIKADGSYVYAHRLNVPDHPLPGYNYLRHCGTTWYLCKAINELELPLSPADFAALDSSIRFVTERLQEPQWKEGILPRLCFPEEDGDVKIGANGLALLMLHEYGDLCRRTGATEASVADDLTIARLENYILSQAGAEDFVHKRRLSDGKISTFRSDYYTGEALFGLARGGRLTPKIKDLFERMIEDDYGIRIQSHWMAYAACEVLDRRLIAPDVVAPYIGRLMRRIIRHPAYRERNESTPIACRSEALLRVLRSERNAAYLGFPFKPELLQSIRSAASENLTLQRRWYEAGQFWKGDGRLKVQIDYIQHNAMSFLFWYMLNR